MKNQGGFLFLILAVITLFAFWSCERKDSDRNGKGMIAFTFSPGNQINAAKSSSADSGTFSFQLMISIEEPDGTPVLTDEMIPLYQFGSGFISEKIEIRTGEFNLTRFIVIDPSGQAIFAAPVEGSPLAYITTDPLPISFTVSPGQVTSVIPEVIPVENHTPGDFGYTSFGIGIVKPLEFYAVCYLDNPLIMAPTQLTDANLTVYSTDGWYYTFYLRPEVNHLVIRGGSNIYTFVVSKEGYETQTYQFTASELLNATKENPLGLKIPWGVQYNKVEIQPGPDEGKDAMITNLNPDKNFGDYKYFEATFLTEPILTVMRSNRSLIAFDLNAVPKSAIIRKVTLQLSYDLPIPFDSSYFSNTDPATGATFVGAVLQQVIEPWDEYKVAWNKQPATTEMNQVYIYPFIRNCNFIQVDVTCLFINPSASLLPNYGMLFRLWPDDRFPGFRFASSDYADPVMRPKLTVYYTL